MNIDGQMGMFVVNSAMLALSWGFKAARLERKALMAAALSGVAFLLWSLACQAARAPAWTQAFGWALLAVQFYASGWAMSNAIEAQAARVGKR